MNAPLICELNLGCHPPPPTLARKNITVQKCEKQEMVKGASVCILTHNLDSYLQADNRVFVVFVYIFVCVCVCLYHQRQWQSLPRVFALNFN